MIVGRSKRSRPQPKETLEEIHGEIWTPEEFGHEFEIIGLFVSPMIVRRILDGAKGTIEFQDSPRYYFNFQMER